MLKHPILNHFLNCMEIKHRRKLKWKKKTVTCRGDVALGFKLLSAVKILRNCYFFCLLISLSENL